MFMDHSYTQTEIDNYKLQVELLEEKLKRSEEHRHHLEHKLGQILKKRSEHDKKMRMKAQEKHQQFAEEQEKRNKRNKELLQMLERIDEQSATLSARSERLKMVKLQYEMYFAKLFKAHTMSSMQGSVTMTTPSISVIRSTDLLQQTVEGDEVAPILAPPQPLTKSFSPSSPTITQEATSITPGVDKALRNLLSGCQNLEILDHATTRASFGSLLKSNDCDTGSTVVENSMTVAQLASPYWTFELAMPTPTGSLFTSAPSTLASAQTQTAAVAQQSTALAESAQTTKIFRTLDDPSQRPVRPCLTDNSLAQINEEKLGIREEERNALREMLLPTNTAFDAADVLSKHRGIRKGMDSNKNIRINDEHNVKTNDNTVVYNETSSNNDNNNKRGVQNNKGLISPMPSGKHDDIRAVNILRNRQIPISDNKEICNRDDSNNNDLNNNNNNRINDNSNNNKNDYDGNDDEGGWESVNLDDLRKCAISRQVTNIPTTPSLFKTTSASPLTQSSESSTRMPSSLTFNKLKISEENVKVFQQTNADEYEGDMDVTTTTTTAKLANTYSSQEIVEPTQTADFRSNNTCIKDKKSANFVERNCADQAKNNADSEKLTGVSETDDAISVCPIYSVSGRGCRDEDDISMEGNMINYNSQKIDWPKLALKESNRTALETTTTTTTTTATKPSISQTFPHFERKKNVKKIGKF